jgi:hypothetical protein
MRACRRNLSRLPHWTRCGRPSATATRARSGVDAGVPAPRALHGIGRRRHLLLAVGGRSKAVSLVSASSRTTRISRRPSSASRSRIERPTLISCLDVPGVSDDDGNRGHFVSNKLRTPISTGLSVSNSHTPGPRCPIKYPLIASLIREAVNSAIVRVASGETRTRTGDSTIFSRAARPS